MTRHPALSVPKVPAQKILAALVLAACALPAGAETYTICTEADYPPYMAMDADGNLFGFDHDLGLAICAALGADCGWNVLPFADILDTVAAGGCDLAIASLAATPARREIVDFSDPYFPGGPGAGVFAGMNPSIPIEGARIGVQAGTIHAEHLAATGREVVTFATNAEALAALAARQVDLVFTSDSVMRRAQELQYPGLRLVGVEEFEGWGTAVAVRRGNDGLRDRISEAIHALLGDGSIGRLQDRWFNAGITT
ncbi:MAG: amino acid ABC transporter substrate-binding protein [Rubellimicrobium sp.]|nr:amino acid ABC transporter substrate-binding protein [Rubellimicrobium sp.]